MRAHAFIIFVLTGATACRIPTDHFIGTGGDGGGDDGGGSGDAAVDAPPPMVLRKGWIVDSSVGVFPVSKDATTGALTFTTGATLSVPGAQAAISNKLGTHLFVAYTTAGAGPQIGDYTIGAGGTLTASGGRALGGCSPKSLALHPSGDWLAVGCSSTNLAIIKLTNGTIDTAAVLSVQQLPTSPHTVLFNAAGTCLFGADRSAPQTSSVAKFSFDATGIATLVATMQGPVNANALAMHPSGEFLYAVGNTEAYAYQTVVDCGLTLLDTKTGGSSTLAAQAVLTPNGTRLFKSSGPEIRAYDVGADGKLTPSATPVTNLPTIVTHLDVDRAVQGIVYVTMGAGTQPATINAGGALALGAQAGGGGSNAVYFSMSP